MEDPKLTKLKELIKLTNDGLTRQEFIDAFKEVLKIVKELQEMNKKEFRLIHQFVQTFSSEIKSNTSLTLTDMKKQVNHVFVEKRFAEMKKILEDSVGIMHGKMSEIETTISRKMSTVKDGYTPIKGKDYFDGNHGNMLTPVEVRDKLEHLQGDARLDLSAIKGIDELGRKIESKIPTRIYTPAKSYQIHTKDCTSQCNGNTKTFNVGGSHFGIIGVFSTEFPQIYRPVIDYTESRNGFTLTAAVSAPITGQTLIAQFLK